MVCRVITRDGNHYISYAGFPYVWCGPDEPSICTTGDIVTDYCISFIDEAHPHYVIGTGNVGSLWGPDVYYYYNEMSTLNPAFPACGHILFDVDTARVAKSGLSSDPFFVYPTGVNDSNLTGCYMPTPEMNIIRIERPSGVSTGTISQETFANTVLSNITDIWGTGFYNRMAAVSGTHKLWIIQENSDSLRTTVIESGINIIKNTLIASGINVQQYTNYCSTESERYLGWIVDCIKYNGDNVSCTGMGQIPNIIQHECYCSGSSPTNKLTTVTVHGYGSGIDEYGIGDPPWTTVIVYPPYDNYTPCTGIGTWPSNGLVGYYSVVNLDSQDLQYLETEIVYQIKYQGGIPQIEVTSTCSQEIDDSGIKTVSYKFISEIPLDNYGLPNGSPVFEDFEILSDDGGNCIPENPDIVFFSHPPTQQTVCIPVIPSGPQDCESINP